MEIYLSLFYGTKKAERKRRLYRFTNVHQSLEDDIQYLFLLDHSG